MKTPARLILILSLVLAGLAISAYGVAVAAPGFGLGGLIQSLSAGDSIGTPEAEETETLEASETPEVEESETPEVIETDEAEETETPDVDELDDVDDGDLDDIDDVDDVDDGDVDDVDDGDVDDGDVDDVDDVDDDAPSGAGLVGVARV